MNANQTDPLKLEGQLAALRLELDQRDREIEGLQQEIQRLSFGQVETSEETLRNRLTSLFEAVSLPCIQVWTQVHLVEKKAKVLQAQDVLSSAKRLAAALRAQGLEPIGEVDQVVPFDLALHVLLGNQEIAPGDLVRVRLVGTQYQGKILRKANVEKAEGSIHAGQAGD